MTISPSALPRDVRSLRRMIIEKEALLSERAQAIAEKEAQLAERDRAIAVRDAELYAKTLQIEHLRAQLAVLRRHRFGRSSEKLDREIEQLELTLGELEEGVAESKSRAARAEKASAPAARASEDHKHGRKPMPAHLPRERTVHEPAPTCTACGGTVLRKLGEDVTELLEYIPSSFKVVQIVRPKWSCRACETIAQAPLPSFPIERGRPGPGLLAQVVVSKYADGLPLYRQSEIYARQDIDIDRSTMADWVGCMAALLDPLVAAIGKHVCAGEVLHADDTTVKVLAPGLGRTKTGRLWAAVRDERPFGGTAAPAAFYRYSADHCAEHAHVLLGSCRGFLHADGYAGFNELFADDPKTGKPRLTEVACWAHARRYIYEVYESTASPLAKEALERIADLFAIEARINGRSPVERLAVRQREAVRALRIYYLASLSRAHCDYPQGRSYRGTDRHNSGAKAILSAFRRVFQLRAAMTTICLMCKQSFTRVKRYPNKFCGPVCSMRWRSAQLKMKRRAANTARGRKVQREEADSRSVSS